MTQPGQSEQHQESDAQPVYNIKAAVEATGLPAATLRAWERRYGALSPQRTESGYRLYSANDIALLRWLKLRVDEGMTIGQATVLLNRRRTDEATHPSSDNRQIGRHGTSGLRDSLVESLTGFDESQADHIMEQAFAIFGVEMVLERIAAPAMAEIGDLWHKGVASTAVEHFASNYLRRKIDTIINAAPQISSGPLVVMGCAPDDWHELGLLSLYLMARRRGLNTIYLGQSVPRAQFMEEMVRLQPRLLVMSAATSQSVSGLTDLAEAVQAMPPPRPLFGYGGHIFNTDPALRAAVTGVFLGESARSAVEYMAALLARPAAPEADQRGEWVPGCGRG